MSEIRMMVFNKNMGLESTTFLYELVSFKSLIVQTTSFNYKLKKIYEHVGHNHVGFKWRACF